MERLTKRDIKGRVVPKDSFGWRAMEKLAEYEDAEEEGRLVVLPCKVGQTIYKVLRRKKVILSWKVEGFLFDGSCWKVRATEIIPSWIGNQKEHHYVSFSVFGKTVFTTKAEAESALEKMKGE